MAIGALGACLCAFVPFAPLLAVLGGRLRRDVDPGRRAAGRLVGAFALWLAFTAGMLAAWGIRALGPAQHYLNGLLVLAQPVVIWFAFRLAGADDGPEESLASRRDAARRAAEQPPTTF